MKLDVNLSSHGEFSDIIVIICYFEIVHFVLISSAGLDELCDVEIKSHNRIEDKSTETLLQEVLDAHQGSITVFCVLSVPVSAGRVVLSSAASAVSSSEKRVRLTSWRWCVSFAWTGE